MKMTLQPPTHPPQTQCRQYLSCYLPNFDQTLELGSKDHLEQIFHQKNFAQKFFCRKTKLTLKTKIRQQRQKRFCQKKNFNKNKIFVKRNVAKKEISTTKNFAKKNISAKKKFAKKKFPKKKSEKKIMPKKNILWKI